MNKILVKRINRKLKSKKKKKLRLNRRKVIYI